MIIRTLLTQLVLPPALNLLLLVLGLLLARRFRRTGLALMAVAVLSLFAFSVPAVKEQIYRPLEIYPPVDTAVLAQLDPARTALVVLGGGLRGYTPEYSLPMLSDASVRRVLYAHHLLEQLSLPVLIAGGSPFDEPVSEANRMGLLLQQWGRQPAWLEQTSRTTWENAVNAAAILKTREIDTVVLVTDAWHMQRSVDCFLARQINVVPAPTGFRGDAYPGIRSLIPEGRTLADVSVATREWLGILLYRISYGIAAAPAPDAQGVIRAPAPPAA